MEENGLSELEIEEAGERIRLKKFSESDAPVIQQINPTLPTEEKKEELAEVKSPMVGTFYRGPSPGAKSYVEVDDAISSGAVVCIIEAMKLMNEIKAEVGGKIKEILVENGQPVEFGQTLFLMEPA